MPAKDATGKEKPKRPIVMLANGHNAFDTRIFIKEARTLVQAGFSVSIIVPHVANEQRDGISIIAVDSITTGFSKLVVSPWRILRKAISQPSNGVFHIHDSDILIVGIILKFLGRRVVYDAHEDTPLQISYQHWLPSLLKKPYAFFYFLLEKFCGWIFDAIIVAEPVISKYFPEKKTYLVRNFPVAKSFEGSATPYANRPSKMVHVGTLSEVRGLIEMLEGVRSARQFVDIEFVLGGKFAPASLEQRVTGEYRVTYLSWLSYPALVDLLYTARIGIIIPHPIPRYKTNYPVKLFEFMASGLPVIASVEGEAAAFVKEGECGILVDPLDIGEIANAIRWLLEHGDEAEAMGKRGQMLIFSKYNWENEAKVLLQVYNQM